MQKRRLRAPSPALVISLIALFVALGGTAYASTGLAKNSVGTKQLKAGAVTAPKIHAGAVTGAAFATGAQTTLASGQTLKGVWAASGDAAVGSIDSAVGFNFALASPPVPQYVASGSAPPNCPGTVSNPEAAAGHLCVYRYTSFNVSDVSVCSLGNCPGATSWGFQLAIGTSGSGEAYVRGSYAVTAP